MAREYIAGVGMIEMRPCRYCGGDRGLRPRYCSDVCRRAFWRFFRRVVRDDG